MKSPRSTAFLIYYAMILEIIGNLFADSSNAGILFDLVIKLFLPELEIVEIFGISTGVSLPGLVLGGVSGTYAALSFSLARFSLNQYHQEAELPLASSPKVALVSDEENALLDKLEQEKAGIKVEYHEENKTGHFENESSEQSQLIATHNQDYHTKQTNLTPQNAEKSSGATLKSPAKSNGLSPYQKSNLAGFAASSVFDNTALFSVWLQLLANKYDWPTGVNLGGQLFFILMAIPSVVPLTKSCANAMRMRNLYHEAQEEKKKASLTLFRPQGAETSPVTSPHLQT